MKKCCVEKCERESYSKGYCRKHYDQIRWSGKITIEKLPPIQKCKVEECNHDSLTKGYCSKHYMQTRKYGKILEETIFDKNVIEIKENYAEIILKNKQKEEVARALIDIEDVEKVKEIKWCLITNDGYVKGGIGAKEEILLHRFLFKSNNNELIDHINGNKLDNRKCNLRIVDYSKNAMNSKTPSNNTSGIKGVYWDKRSNKWEAAIQINMKKKSLGYFKNKEDAIKARKEAEKELFGEYARKE